MNVAAFVTWVGRFVFLALLYVFIFQLYRALLGAHSGRSLHRQGRVVLVSSESNAGVWLEERDGKERRLAQNAAVLVDGELTIGRGAQNSVRVVDPHTSNRHCVIRCEKDGYVLQDLSTTNGTYVDGARVRDVARLRPNSEIKVGSVQFRFEVT